LSGGALHDGGVSSLVPVRAARAIGTDVVIAVEIDCHGPRAQGLSAPATVGRVMQTQNCLLAAPEMAEADLLIAPGVKVSGMGAKDEQEAAIEAGYEAARGEALAGVVGKVGGQVLGQFADGVFFIDLAPVSDAALLASTVASACGLVLGVASGAGAASFEDRLVEALARRKSLVIVDNCEHMVEAVADLLCA